MSDTFTERIFLEFGYNEMEIFPMILHDKDVVVAKLPKLYNEEHWCNNLFDEQAYRALLDLLYIALGKQWSKQEIESQVDVRLSLAIIKKFQEVSQLQSKQTNDKPMEWKQLYASLLQNTSMNMNDILQLTVGQLEDLLDGIATNNKTQGSGKEVLKDNDAIRYLMGHQG